MASCPNFPLHLSFSLSVCLVQCPQLLLQSLGFPHPSLPTIQVLWYNLDSILRLQQISFFLAGFIAGFLQWSLSQTDTILGRQVYHQETFGFYASESQEKREKAGRVENSTSRKKPSVLDDACTEIRVRCRICLSSFACNKIINVYHWTYAHQI